MLLPEQQLGAAEQQGGLLNLAAQTAPYLLPASQLGLAEGRSVAAVAAARDPVLRGGQVAVAAAPGSERPAARTQTCAGKRGARGDHAYGV